MSDYAGKYTTGKTSNPLSESQLKVKDLTDDKSPDFPDYAGGKSSKVPSKGNKYLGDAD